WAGNRRAARDRAIPAERSPAGGGFCRRAGGPGRQGRNGRPAPLTIVPSALGVFRREVTEKKGAVQRGEIETPRRLVDELDTIRLRIRVELVVDPPNGLLDRCLARAHPRSL